MGEGRREQVWCNWKLLVWILHVGGQCVMAAFPRTGGYLGIRSYIGVWAGLFRNPAAHPTRGRPYKSWAKHRKPPDQPSWKNRIQPVTCPCGRITHNQTHVRQTRLRHPGVPMTFGAWNVRTLLDLSIINPDRPERRTALVTKELARFNIDIAALSETRFSWKKSVPGTPSSGKGGRKANVGSMVLALQSNQPLYACTN